MQRNETRLVQSGVFVHYYLGGDILTDRVSCVTTDQAASGGKSNGDMMATIDLAQAMQLELAYQVAADGRATVRVCGELDIATADQAYAYLRDVVDSQSGPVTMNLAELTFCDAAGLGVLARVAGHARRSGRSIKLAAARPSMVRIMRITGMDEAFPEVRSQALAMISWPRQASVATNN
jgi:anti-anti-sigma factor